MHATDHICSTTLGSMSLVLQNFLDKEAAVSKIEVRTIFSWRKRHQSIRLPVPNPILVSDPTTKLVNINACHVWVNTRP